MAKNEDEPTMEIDEDEFILEDDEPTMEVDDVTSDLDVSDNEAGFDVSDDEVGHEDEDEVHQPGGYASMMAQVVQEIPSAASFNALLIVSILLYFATLVLVLWRLGDYAAPGALLFN